MSDDPLLRAILTYIAFSIFLLGLCLSMPWLQQQYRDWQVRRLKRQLRRELDRLQRECHAQYERMPAAGIAQILTWREQIDQWDPPILPAQPKEEDMRDEHTWLYDAPGQRPSVRDMLEIPPMVSQYIKENPWWNQEHKRLMREIDEILEREQF